MTMLPASKPEPALVAVALGNSRAAATLVTGGAALGKVTRAPIERLEDLTPVLARACPDCGGEATAVAIASVNPPALARLLAMAKEMHLAKPLVAGDDFPIPMRTDVDEPERVGTDRLLAALAAYRRNRSACIVVDCGTAITVNAVRAGGVFVGGAIFPGLAMMARSLARGTALLPEAVLPDRAPPVGKNTEQAIAAGILHGAAGAVANLVIVASEIVGSDAAVFLTGGDAARLAEFLPPDCRDVSPDLVLEGLAIAYREWSRG
jgi:type III pantothenate kinase